MAAGWQKSSLWVNVSYSPSKKVPCDDTFQFYFSWKIFFYWNKSGILKLKGLNNVEIAKFRVYNEGLIILNYTVCKLKSSIW
jgi:hypothetical protein